MMPTTSAASTPSRRVMISASSTGGPSRPARFPGHALGDRAVAAEAGDLQIVPRGLEAVGARDLAQHRGDGGAAEFDHASTVGAHQMVVLLSGVHVLEALPALAHLVTPHQAATDHQVQVAIDRGAGDRRSAPLHGVEQSFGVDVSVLGEDLVEDLQPLGRHAQALAADKVLELLKFLARRHGSSIAVLEHLETYSQVQERFWTV